MKILRLIQAAIIFFLLFVVAVAMMGISDSSEDMRMASLWLLSESAACGLAGAIFTIIRLQRAGAENFTRKLSTLMFLTLGVFALAWTTVSHFAGLHEAEGLSYLTRFVRVGYGYLAGWFSVVLFLFVLQIMSSHDSSEECEDEREERGEDEDER
ncbi:MAG: hypothetical protein U5N86_03170 [Planctomycetota bacterium]|nr:hypothetical protein [Planctomycetota bacterium]